MICGLTMVLVCALVSADRCSDCIQSIEGLKESMKDPAFIKKWRDVVLKECDRYPDEARAERCREEKNAQFDEMIAHVEKLSPREYCVEAKVCDSKANVIGTIYDKLIRMAPLSDECDICIEEATRQKKNAEDPEFVKKKIDDCKELPPLESEECIRQYERYIEFVKTHTAREACIEFFGLCEL